MTGSTVRPPAYQLLADELRDEITSGRLQPGERLPPEPELCVRSGVSRSTVREALRLLASQHLIVTTRGVTGGSFVAHPDAQQLSDALSTGLTLLTNSAEVGLADLLELRRAVEIPAAGLAAERRSDAHLVELRGAMFDPDLDELDTMMAAHAAFHSAIASATCNPLFELVTRPLYNIGIGEEVVEGLPDGYWERIDADHRDLLTHVRNRDSAGAMEAGRRHLDYIAAVAAR
ncbi:FadR/GntR family transcriptional regulator [Couchioplanes caeruleus]|uniref:GntR family transcriptional regulator n=2 Tax=Couchioplanes caeruleus TaxID=56438 RepID=A0A1K0GIR4_9ACTN|nr:GntR family transcriptional regulator [Couchioplanes caeruleus]OJF10820.1 GntR family transcriptional regulator [Couchioplanes caeruleus subsp. caeruleus]ROP32212.1 GntR family transcriptional regulator [Couchioplanes caeruleus]